MTEKTYVDQTSFHYQPQFKHLKTYELDGGKCISAFIDDDLNCVIETREYADDYSKCEIRQVNKKMTPERANFIMRKFTH